MYPSLYKLARLYYWTAKGVSEERHNPLSSLFFGEQVIFLFYGLLRFFLLGTLWARSIDLETSLLRHDYICYISVAYQTNYDTPLALVVASLSVYSVFGQTLLYRLPETSFSLVWLQQMVVGSQEAYTAALYSREKRERLLERETERLLGHLREVYPLLGSAPDWSLAPVARLLARKAIWKRMDHVNRRTLARWRPSVHPNLSPTLRYRLLQALLLTDGLCLLFQVFLHLIMLLGGLVILSQFYGAVPWWNVLPVLTEATAAYLSIFALVNVGVFFTLSTLISGIVNVGHCQEICRKLRKVMAHRKGGKMRMGAFSVYLRGFQGEYYRCIDLAIKGNGELFSPVLCGFLLSCLPAHVYLM